MPLVATGFQADVKSGSGNRVPLLCGIAQCHDFGMRAAAYLGVAFANDPVVAANDNRTHSRVWRTNGPCQQSLLVAQIGKWISKSPGYFQHVSLNVVEPAAPLTHTPLMPCDVKVKPPQESEATGEPVIGDMVSV